MGRPRISCYTKSLERAVAWRAALTALKETAKKRLLVAQWYPLFPFGV